MTFTLFLETLLRESYSHKVVTVKNQGERRCSGMAVWWYVPGGRPGMVRNHDE